MALDLAGSVKFDVSSAQASGVHSIDNPLVLGEHCGRSAFAERVVGVLGSTFSPVARNQVSQWWWLELVVKYTLVVIKASAGSKG